MENRSADDVDVSNGHVDESKIVRALKRKRAALQHEKGTHAPATFTRIILKFGVIHKVLTHVHEVFSKVDTHKTGRISKEDLVAAFELLHVKISRQAVGELYEISNVSQTHRLNLKEFMVCLVVSKVLDIIPGLSSPQGAGRKSIQEGTSQGGSGAGLAPAAGPGEPQEAGDDDSLKGVLTSHAQDLRTAMDLIVQAYLLFDKEAKGYISRAELDSILEEADDSKDSGQKHKFFSDDAWSSMDWDHNGRMSFEEFVYTFSAWVDIDDESVDD